MDDTMEALLKVRNLSIGINHRCKDGENRLFSAAENISFDIYNGEILGIVGESGSGKSLTALSIPGLLGENMEVTSGSILYRKNDSVKDLLALSEKELQSIRGKEISFVFQEPFSSLNPLVKVGNQIEETLKLHSKKNKEQIKKQARELMEKLKLPEPDKLAEKYPHQLSGGMCQRVMIAMAIICSPRLLIADEPTTALDQNIQLEIISLLKKINRDFGTSILFISHDLSLVKKLCSRVLVMYSGRVLEEGGTREIFSRPAHEYTKGLWGSIPDSANRGKALAAIPGKIPSLEEGRPPGCPFHPRCVKASLACMESFPPEKTVGTNHRTHCVLGADE